jgi:sialic acid synthase SpsE
MKKNKILIIAEIGVNHNGDVNLAKRLILEAKKSGADAVKFQNFIAENLSTYKAPKADYQLRNTKSSSSQFKMLKKLELSKKQYFQIKKFAKKNNIIFFTSIFDEESLEFVQKKLKNKFIKIPSGEINNYFILDKLDIMNFIIISSGMSSLNDIALTINRIYKKKIYKILSNNNLKINKKLLNKIKNKICIMHCVSNYPVESKYANLLSIPYLKNKLKLNIGYSDHTEGNIAPVIAASLGATMIEKHLTLNNKINGPDHKMSLEPKAFKKMVNKIRTAENMLGKYNKIIQKCEIKNIKIIKKSIVAKNLIKIGEKFSLNNITAKRPYINIAPSKIDNVLGKRAKRVFNKNSNIIL